MTKWFVMGLMTMGLTLQAQAEGAAAAKGDGPCAKDRETLCANVQPGKGGMMKCMSENKDKLSSECKAHMDKMKEHMKEAKEACHDDVEKFCSDVKPGGGRVMKCMKEHKDEVSGSCKEEMSKRKGMRGGRG